MPLPSTLHMPGGFQFEPQASTASRVHPGIFRPPASSPSASSSTYLTKSTGSLLSENTTSKRKRRHDNDRDSTPLREWTDGAPVITPGAAVDNNFGPAAGESRYVLAGQIETPGGANPRFSNGILDESMYSDADYRRALGSRAPHHEEEESPAGRHTTLVRPQQSSPSDGWSRLAMNTIGGMVGRVWEFCKAGAFKGFYAGGGTGYALSSTSTTATPPAPFGGRWPDEDVPTLNASEMVHSVPGTFPETTDDYAPRYAGYHHAQPVAAPSRETQATPTRPAAKRRQTSHHDELRRNWVMVGGPETETESVDHSSKPRPTPRRVSSRSTATAGTIASGRRISVPASRLNSTTATTRRQASQRISHAGSPTLSSREPASFAAPRSPRASSPAVGTPSRIPVASRPGSSRGTVPLGTSSSQPLARKSAIPTPIQTSFSMTHGSPGHGHGHRRSHSSASAASARAPLTKPKDRLADDIDASPRLTDEAKHLAAMRLREERDADVKMASFNARLKEMIREGREALGTRFEVVGLEGGWEDDD